MDFNHYKPTMSSPVTLMQDPLGSILNIQYHKHYILLFFICFIKGEKGEVGMRGRDGNTGIKVNISILVIFVFLIFLQMSTSYVPFRQKCQGQVQVKIICLMFPITSHGIMQFHLDTSRLLIFLTDQIWLLCVRSSFLYDPKLFQVRLFIPCRF